MTMTTLHKVTFQMFNGDTKVVETPSGLSVLETALAHDIELEHACGGFCACTTCHVIIKDGTDEALSDHFHNHLTNYLTLFEDGKFTTSECHRRQAVYDDQGSGVLRPGACITFLKQGKCTDDLKCKYLHPGWGGKSRTPIHDDTRRGRTQVRA